ncbi:MAG TPA: MarR family transcriptional regulator [Hyphomicrobiaceae bacterium]|nr:MarR family transcriptional regulator [Hyphomicrobiaceae bacterium]
MADIIPFKPVGATGAPSTAAAPEAVAPEMRLVELLFFGYRAFTSEPDAILAELDFGRAHHRVLHFVARRPGLRVAELLDILRITKQSLARVLKQLVDEGFVEQRSGVSDRRERRLYATPAGRQLHRRLADLQCERIRAALAAVGPDCADLVARFLSGMIGEEDRSLLLTLLAPPE